MRYWTKTCTAAAASFGILWAAQLLQAADPSAKEAFAESFDVAYGEVYANHESGPLKADLYVPTSEGPHPGVLVVHGGAWYTGTRAQLAGVARRLASNGFTAVAISYRLAPQHKFPAQIEDCKTAVRWMREHADRLKLDPSRIGGFGYSAGAHLVALLGTTDPDDGLEGVDDPSTAPSTRLQAVCGGGAPCDFRPMPPDNKMLAFWLGGTPAEQPEQYRRASPAEFVSADDPPMFFFHGEADRLVPAESPQRMVAALRSVGVPADLYIAPKMGHLIAVMDPTSLEKSLRFLTSRLQSARAPEPAAP